MNTPTYDAQGNQVWNPQPGQNWKYGLRYRESFGGTIAALNDIKVGAAGIAKTYPHNWAGIIAAIEDLSEFMSEGSLPIVEAPPPGWEIIVDGDGNIDGNWQEPPRDGQLWFDVRQGRLFIALDGEYYQTNGADGISYVSDDPPAEPTVKGQTWLDTDTGLFYVNNGSQWQAVISDGDITLTTATLPLAINRATFNVYQPNIIPDVPVDSMHVQKDFNEYIYASVVALDQANVQSTVHISETPPTENIEAGSLWYDSNTLELSVYYTDDDSSQWVPITVAYSLEEELKPFQDQLDTETRIRELAVHDLHEKINELTLDDSEIITNLTSSVGSINGRLDTLESFPLADYALDTDLKALEEAVNGINVPDMTPYATIDQTAALFLPFFSSMVESMPRLTEDDVELMLPDVSNFITANYVENHVNTELLDYLPKAGGVITGNLVFDNNDIGLTTLDVSQSAIASRKLFELQSQNSDGYTAVFGANAEPWELSWDFIGDEDFCWNHNDNKVFSINRYGPACSQLHIGAFGMNDDNGRRLYGNTIEVGERIRRFEQAFADIKQAVVSCSDFDSFRAHINAALTNV